MSQRYGAGYVGLNKQRHSSRPALKSLENHNFMAENHYTSSCLRSVDSKNNSASTSQDIAQEATRAKYSSEELSQNESLVGPNPLASSSANDAVIELCERTPGKGNVLKVRNQSTNETSRSRKIKSLGLVCQRFFRIMYETLCSGQKDINLKDIAEKMKIEKRRVYDIVNVLEGLKAIEKGDKGHYKWIGLDKLPSLIYEFKVCALQSGTYKKFKKATKEVLRLISSSDRESPDTNDEELLEASCSSSMLNHEPLLNGAWQPWKSPTDENNKPISPDQSNQRGAEEGKKRKDRQEKENSLAYLCKELLMILISAKEHKETVSLDVASTMLIKNPEIQGYDPPGRSHCRRIYDVANILIAMRLVRRTISTLGTKKLPCYVYCGPSPCDGDFDYFSYIDEHKLFMAKTNKEEKEALKVEEEKFSDLLRKKCPEKSKSAHLPNDYEEPKTKRAKVEATEPTRGFINDNKENEPLTHINCHILPPNLPTIRPEPQEMIISRSNFIPQMSHQQCTAQVAPPATPSVNLMPALGPTILPTNCYESFHGNNLPLNSVKPDYLNNFTDTLLLPHFISQQPRGPTIDARGTFAAGNPNVNSNLILGRNIQTTARNPQSVQFNFNTILTNPSFNQSWKEFIYANLSLATLLIHQCDPFHRSSLLQRCIYLLNQCRSDFGNRN